MKIATMRKVSVLAALAACGVAAGAEPVAAFAFEEGTGAYAEDSVCGLTAELTPAAKWAKGAFGSALATGADGASAMVRGLEAINGADACTLFLRFRKEGPGSGKYPNLLTSIGWGPKGGIMFFCEGGKSMLLRLRAGGKGPENGWLVFKSMPKGKWSSVAFVYRRPQITVYADGKEVARGQWDHPFVVGGTIQLGGWNSDSFGGFIDDFRVWKGALGAEEIASLAGDSRYDEIEGYQDDGTGGIRKTEVWVRAMHRMRRLMATRRR